MTICCTRTIRPAAGTCGASICPPTCERQPRRPGGCRHRRTAVGARRAVVRPARGRPHRRRPHERRRRARAGRRGRHGQSAAGIRHRGGLHRGRPRHAGARLGCVGAMRRARSGSIDVERPDTAELIHGGPPAWGREWMPSPRAVTFEGPTGPVHAFDYPPTNPGVQGPEGELPPYLVFVHGGPTAHAAARHRAASPTSRAAASASSTSTTADPAATGARTASACAVSGASWTCDDVAAAATGLAATGAADAARIAIAGGSAGGWTVLAALVGTDAFAAGISPLRGRRCAHARRPTPTTSRRATSTG